MKMRRVISAFLATVCILSLFAFNTLGISAEGERVVYATTSASVKQGSGGTAYVYLDDLTDLSAITVSVYYDPGKITVGSVYNSVPCILEDHTSQSGCLQFTYIFDGKGSQTKTRLFYFYYTVNSTAEVGDTFFDIVISDAYDSSVKPMNIVGSRCKFTVTEKTAAGKTCSIYSTSSVSTSVKEEFTLSYRLSTYQIASGSFTIQYDPELFEVAEVTAGAFLDGKVTDINSSLDGAISVSFVGTEYVSKSDLITVKFRTLKNATESSDIKLNVTEFYDLQLNNIISSGYTTKAQVVFDESYTEDNPAVILSSVFDEESGKVTLSVLLEENSNLGAGDFVLNFDPEMLQFISAEKSFAPTFFNFNDKQAAEGILKFSIISTVGITNSATMLKLTFDAKLSDEENITSVSISGSGLVDYMVNPIVLNFIGTEITLPAEAPISGDADGNRVIDSRDLILLRQYLAYYNYASGVSQIEIAEGADFNKDGKVNTLDIVELREYLINQ